MVEVVEGGEQALCSPLCLYLRSLDKEQALAGSSGTVSIMYEERKLPGLERRSFKTQVKQSRRQKCFLEEEG